jgi:hypothetical protein
MSEQAERVPIGELSLDRRQQAALDLLEQAKREGREELPGSTISRLTGLSAYHAFEIKKRFRDQHKPARRTHMPSEVSWQKIQDFLDAHPGQTYNARELSVATGVPRSTVAALWKARVNGGSPTAPLPAPAQPAPDEDYPLGTVFKVVAISARGPVIAGDDGRAWRLEEF